MSELTGKKQGNKAQRLDPQKVSRLFFKGQYTHILQSYQLGPASFAAYELPFIIGALSFLGKVLEAEELYRSRHSEFSDQEKAAAIFYLGVGVMRKAKYQKARTFFKMNQDLYHKHDDPNISFYSYQGIAFYLYYTGRILRSRRYATKAFRRAVQAQDSQLKVLAQDQLAHSLIQSGRIYEGLELLREAHFLSLELDNVAFAAATKVSALLYEAEYGHRRESMLQELKDLLAEVNAQDTYSKSNIALELSRQLLLRGAWLEAEQILNSQAHFIFATQNRRQEITLNLRWADLAFQRGQFVLAWQYLRNARLRLDTQSGRALEIQILSLELKILEEHESVENEKTAAETKNKLLQLSRSFGRNRDRNMLVRRKLIDPTLASGEDHIHAILSDIQERPDTSVQLVTESGYLSWFYKCVPLKRGQNYIALGLVRNHLVLFSSDGVQAHPLADFSQRILEALRHGFITKQELVERVWGYRYHPLRHDSLVYAAMSTLRKNLGTKNAWLQSLDSGYKLIDNVIIYNAVAARQAASLPVTLRPAVDADLNYRQLQVLDYLQGHRFISAREYKELFQTTGITASRDLASLYDKKYVVRVGHGRSTRYSLSPENRK